MLGALNFGHLDDIVVLEPDHVDILDDVHRGLAEPGEVQAIDTFLTKRLAVVLTILIVSSDVDIVSLIQT